MHTILSIDDSQAVHAYLDVCFAQSGIKLIHALNAKEGIKKLIDFPGTFSLILLDWEMPDMNGPEALVQMIDMGIKIPIVMVTSKNNLTDISEALDKGASEYIIKPFTPDIIISKVQSMLSGDI